LDIDAVQFLKLHKAHGYHSGPHESFEAQAIVSFDVEEHFRIEAAADVDIGPDLKAHYRERLEPSTRWLLERLDEVELKATFFVVGEIARDNPGLVKAIADAGHEVASHGWDHKRLLRFTPQSFREDVRKSKDALEQAAGQAICGYRAPTFSIMRETAWALDVLAELDFTYDSSIYPVRHDRYGVPDAPRAPFLAAGLSSSILEIPPATLRLLKVNLPMGGGGYFRLFPLFFTAWAVRQMAKRCSPPVAMLYFHPWEFDPEQKRLPLGWFNRFRTYIGIRRSRSRLTRLLARHRFVRALDVAKQLDTQRHLLPRFALAGDLPSPGVLTGVGPVYSEP
jgi:polysaccharide deacetylase family protein (PEP-CTERM system associated)